ncbi:MAG: protein translocase subunit SecD [Alphaproteobacteria bacterium]|nr:protein translocase subunit SecD [Alphaproteobacteria bacterium]
MVNFNIWTAFTTVLICVLGLIFASPNFFPGGQYGGSGVPRILPQAKVNLGLDLQGGSSLLLKIEFSEVIEESLESTVSAIRRALRGERINYTGLGTDGTRITFTLRNADEEDAARRAIANILGDLTVDVSSGGTFTLSLREQALIARRNSVMEQSIEIVRRRVDETGTSEPLIQRQGDDRILVQLPGLDDPERIKRLLGTTAKLNFHMVDPRVGPEDSVPPGSMRLVMQEGGEIVVQREVVVSGDRLVDSQPSFQDGRPVVSFRFDAAGGKAFGKVTADNVGQLLAIVLDDVVVSAPRIQGPIPGGNGIITGQFSVQEASDLALVLRAGALPAPLSILEERSVGPGLGADSIAAGKIASVIGLIGVVIFMVVAYGLFGLMADVALFINLLIILAVLSVLQATLTLPGIAGIVLTIGMAVDANVLIFERIREEVDNGRTPISAIDAGYRRALTTIIDSNLTTLIAAILLFQFGSGPIKGFAVTLSIGIVSSMFTAIMVTRLMVVGWLWQRRPSSLPI